MYKIKLQSYYAEFWRYNVVFTAVGKRTDGEQLYYESLDYSLDEQLQDKALAMFPTLPVELQESTLIEMECAEAELLDVYVHLVPLILPLDKNVLEALPFNIILRVLKDDEMVYEAQHAVNLWGGATIELKLPEGTIYE